MVTMRVVLQQLLEYCARPLSQTPRLVPDCAHRRQGRRQLQHPLLSPRCSPLWGLGVPHTLAVLSGLQRRVAKSTCIGRPLSTSMAAAANDRDGSGLYLDSSLVRHMPTSLLPISLRPQQSARRPPAPRSAVP